MPTFSRQSAQPAQLPTAACLSATQCTYLSTVNTAIIRIADDEDTMALNYQDPNGEQDPELFRAYMAALKDLKAMGKQYYGLKAPTGWERAGTYWQQAMLQFLNLQDNDAHSYLLISTANDNLRKDVATLSNSIQAACP